MDWIEKLKEYERTRLEKDLADPSIWKTLDVDYHPPRVERLYTFFDGNRVCLHVIHPCEEDESLVHPHAWPAGFHVLHDEECGVYEHGVCYTEYSAPTMACKMEFHGEVYYEMDNQDAQHYVRPINAPVYSVMMNGPTEWEDNNAVLPLDKELGPLSDERKAEILERFKKLYGFQ